MATNTIVVMALVILVLLVCSRLSSAQQKYSGNDMLDCYGKPNASSVLGYVCGGGGASSCTSYLYFRSSPPYDTPVQISFLLSADAQNVSSLNNISDAVAELPAGWNVLVPVTCSCNGADSKGQYQHEARYTRKLDNEIYQVIANDTYEGLTTCQAMMAQNPQYDSYHLKIGETFKAPLRCACPTAAQVSAGYRYLVTYPLTWRDDIPTIASRFQTDEEAVFSANGIPGKTTTIFPFSTLLVPLRGKPTSDLVARLGPSRPVLPKSSPVPPTSAPSAGGGSGKGKKWVAAGIGAGIGP